MSIGQYDGSVKLMTIITGARCLQTKLLQCKLWAVVNMIDISAIARVGSKIKNRLKTDRIPCISIYHPFEKIQVITWKLKHGRYGWKNAQLEHSSYECYIVLKVWFSAKCCKMQSTCHFSKMTQIWKFCSKWKWQSLYECQV